jgi:hypothetical protein
VQQARTSVNCCLTEERSSRVWSMVLTVPVRPAAAHVPGGQSEGSSLVVATATLAVVALFQPARRRTQALVDRRFNRRRYDAARTIAAFSGRLREQVDLTTLTAELLAVADRTVEPTMASIWLRPRAEPPARASDNAVIAVAPNRMRTPGGNEGRGSLASRGDRRSSS